MFLKKIFYIHKLKSLYNLIWKSSRNKDFNNIHRKVCSFNIRESNYYNHISRYLPTYIHNVLIIYISMFFLMWLYYSNKFWPPLIGIFRAVFTLLRPASTIFVRPSPKKKINPFFDCLVIILNENFVKNTDNDDTLF